MNKILKEAKYYKCLLRNKHHLTLQGIHQFSTMNPATETIIGYYTSIILEEIKINKLISSPYLQLPQ